MQYEWISGEHNGQAYISAPIQWRRNTISRDTINLFTSPAITRRMQTVTLHSGNLKALE
jgi:hypothetical protein